MNHLTPFTEYNTFFPIRKNADLLRCTVYSTPSNTDSAKLARRSSIVLMRGAAAVVLVTVVSSTVSMLARRLRAHTWPRDFAGPGLGWGPKISRG